MNHLCRRKPFIVVQELNKLENTKSLLSSKLNFLINQSICLLDSVDRSQSVSKEFTKSLFICTSLKIKILQSLLHLTNSSGLCWAFLQTLGVKDPASHVFGGLKIPGFILDTDYISRESGRYFLSLLGMGAIDMKTWRNLTMLKRFSDTMGTCSINDFAYYGNKKLDVIDPLEDLERFDDFESEFSIFAEKPLHMKDPAPVIYPFLKAVYKYKNYSLIKDCMVFYRFNYEALRTDTKFRKEIGLEEYERFSEAVSCLGSISDLYRAVAEMRATDRDKNVDGAFSCLLEYFFSQDSSIFDKDERVHSEFTCLEKVVRAALWLDFMSYMCENSMNYYCTFRKLSFDDVSKNFARACELELSVLKDPNALKVMLLFDSDTLNFIMDRVGSLKKMSFYKRHYAYFMDKYLSFCDSQDL